MLAAEGTECAGRHFRFDITSAAAALAPEPPVSLQLQRRSDVVDFLEACLGDTGDTQAPAAEPVADAADAADAVALYPGAALRGCTAHDADADCAGHGAAAALADVPEHPGAAELDMQAQLSEQACKRARPEDDEHLQRTKLLRISPAAIPPVLSRASGSSSIRSGSSGGSNAAAGSSGAGSLAPVPFATASTGAAPACVYHTWRVDTATTDELRTQLYYLRSSNTGAELLAATATELTGRHFRFEVAPAAAALAPLPLASLRLQRRSDVVAFVQSLCAAPCAAAASAPPLVSAAPAPLLSAAPPPSPAAELAAAARARAAQARSAEAAHRERETAARCFATERLRLFPSYAAMQEAAARAAAMRDAAAAAAEDDSEPEASDGVYELAPGVWPTPPGSAGDDTLEEDDDDVEEDEEEDEDED
jgi:hypothetical protein